MMNTITSLSFGPTSRPRSSQSTSLHSSSGAPGNASAGRGVGEEGGGAGGRG